MAATCIKQSSSPPSPPPESPSCANYNRKKRSRGVQLPVDECMEKLKNYFSMHDVVVLDERGLDIGSEKMAQLGGDAYKTVQCGPYGHGLHLWQRADVTIRLSSTNHQAAIVVLLEQLYRKTSYDLTRVMGTEINVLHIERERCW